MSNNKKPFFSIIIPTYNCAQQLYQALASVERQSFKDFEVIVSDDGSTDNTKETAAAFADKYDIEYIWQKHRGCPACARNSGLKAAKGEYIAFLDSDDWWYADKLQTAERYIRNSDILYHDLDIYTEKGKSVFKKVKGRHLKSPVFVDLMRNENALITSSVVISKKIIDKLEGFSEERAIISLEDFDLWLKVARITEKFIYIPKSLGAYRIGAENISKASQQRTQKIITLYNMHFEFLAPEDRKQELRIMNYLLGRTKQKLGLLKEALESFRVSARSENMKIKFRSICWIILLRYFICLPVVKKIVNNKFLRRV